MEKNENGLDKKVVIPSEKQYADFAPAAIPISDDGGMAPAAGSAVQTPPIPSLTPETFKCLDGPCRHYWHLITLGPDGGTKLKQHHHTCLVNPGMETDFTDECVFECSKHEPITRKERRRRKKQKGTP